MVLKAMTDADRPIAVEEIHERVGKSNCDLVTVYRCLDAFEDAGLVRRYFRISGGAVFDVNLGQSDLHVINKNTHEIRLIEGPEVAALQDAIKATEGALAAKGFMGVSPVIQFFTTGTPSDEVPKPPARYQVKNPSPTFMEKQLSIAIERMENAAKAPRSVPTSPQDRDRPKPPP